MATDHIIEALLLRSRFIEADEQAWVAMAETWEVDDPEEHLALAIERATDAHTQALAHEDSGAHAPIVGAARALAERLCRAAATLVMLNHPAQATWARALMHHAQVTPWSWTALAAQLDAWSQAVVSPALGRELGPFDGEELAAHAKNGRALARALARIADQQHDPEGAEHAERAEALEALGAMLPGAPARLTWAKAEDAVWLDGGVVRVSLPAEGGSRLEDLLATRPGEDVFLDVCAEVDREMQRDTLRTLEVVLPEVEEALGSWPPETRGVNRYTRSWWATAPAHPLARLGRVVEVDDVERWDALAQSDATLRFHASFSWPPTARGREGLPSRTQTQDRLEAILGSDALEQTTRLRLEGFGRVVSSTVQQAEFAPEAVQLGPDRARRIAGDPRLRHLDALGLVDMGVENGPMSILLDDPIYEDLRELELEGELGQRYYYYSILRPLFESASLPRLDRLIIRNIQVFEQELQMLVKHRVWTHFELLCMQGASLTASGMAKFAVSGASLSATRLDLTDNRIGEGVARLKDWRHAKQLRELVLDGNDLAPEPLGRMAEADSMSAMEVLGMARTGATTASIRALQGAPMTPNLERLDVSGNKLTDKSLEVLASLDLARLTHLDASYNKSVTGEGLRALVASPKLGRLQHLDVRGATLSAKLAQRIADDPLLARFRTLTFDTGDIADAAREILRSSPYLHERIRQRL